jgi:hypothetical protein
MSMRLVARSQALATPTRTPAAMPAAAPRGNSWGYPLTQRCDRRA